MIGVRDAGDKDMRYVRRLAVESALHGVPYGRSISNAAIKARVRESISSIQPDEETVVLVAFDKESDKPMGYLILDLYDIEDSTGERQSLIYDLAVHPRHWGTPAVRLLVQEAARRTAQAGLQYMIGEVSAHNDRTYLQALRLGFELERFQIVMACSQEGPEPMPGRPDSEKQYAQSRHKKRSKNRVPRTYEEARNSRDSS
ncbi:MAG: GNAT family N-acetyltransferase [Vulcanimicrobiota bacterium]